MSGGIPGATGMMSGMTSDMDNDGSDDGTDYGYRDNRVTNIFRLPNINQDECEGGKY
jgi:hypothetical protein